MNRRFLRALAVASLASSLIGCSTINRTLSSALKIPGSLLNAAARTVGNMGG